MAARTVTIGKIKKSTEEMIADAIEQQQSWLSRKRSWAGRIFNTSAPATIAVAAPANIAQKLAIASEKNKRSKISAYWFPILCLIIAIAAILWACMPTKQKPEPVLEPATIVLPEPVERTVIKPKSETKSNAAYVVKNSNIIVHEHKEAVPFPAAALPAFDVIRIEKNGRIVIAGRSAPKSQIAVVINKKTVFSTTTNKDGEFVYAPQKVFQPGNYTIRINAKDGRKSDSAFVYVSPRGFENSLSLLMTKDGSRILQAPKVMSDKDLMVTQIDYLANGRVMVQGNALPRLRVTLMLDDQLVGQTRVSDHTAFGLGANIGKLNPGKDYKLSIRLHDTRGTVVAELHHEFTMPEMTPGDETYYTVRRGDTLWVIARNYLGRGIMFSIIADANNIKNPDLIYPDQRFQIPIK